MTVGKDRKYLICMALAIVSSFSFCLENDIYDVPEGVSGKAEIILWKIQNAVNTPTYIEIALLAALFFAYCYLYPKMEKGILKWGIPFAVFSSLAVLLCESYYQYDSWDKVFGCGSAFALSVVRGAGIAILFFFGFLFCNCLGLEIIPAERKTERNWKEFVCIICILMLCWLPYLIIMFPGNVCQDAADEVAQILQNSDYCWTIKSITPEYPDTLWNNHHPVFYTLILAVFVKLGDVIGSHAWGLEIYCILQCGCLAAVFSYLIQYMKRQGVSKKIGRIMLVFFALNPIFPMWGVTLTKDIPFSIVLLMLVLKFYQFLKEPESFTIRSGICMGIWGLLLMLFKNNGFYMLLLMIPFSAWFLWKERRQFVRLLMVIIVPMLVFQIGVQGIFFQVFHISKGSVREMLSVPFQQTARYIQAYGETLDEEDAECILAILGKGETSLQKIGDNYVPDRADRVKSRFNPNATSTDLKNYFAVWGKGLLKHPGTYVEAFLNLNYSWFSFDSRQDVRCYTGITGTDVTNMLEDVKNPEALAHERTMIQYYVKALSKLPFTAWLIGFSCYTWAYLIFFLIMLKRKKYRELVACCILYANYLICFIGPVACTRYAVPMMVCAPAVMIFAFAKEKK